MTTVSSTCNQAPSQNCQVRSEVHPGKVERRSFLLQADASTPTGSLGNAQSQHSISQRGAASHLSSWSVAAVSFAVVSLSGSVSRRPFRWQRRRHLDTERPILCDPGCLRRPSTRGLRPLRKPTWSDVGQNSACGEAAIVPAKSKVPASDNAEVIWATHSRSPLYCCCKARLTTLPSAEAALKGSISVSLLGSHTEQRMRNDAAAMRAACGHHVAM